MQSYPQGCEAKRKTKRSEWDQNSLRYTMKPERSATLS
jgi:hypothetical protein